MTTATLEATFIAAIDEAECLNRCDGLKAIKKAEGHGQITVKKTERALGSVDIDGDCRATYPQSNRWDYVIACSRGKEVIAHYVEVHSAETSEVSKLEKKLEWLKQFLKRPKQNKLAAIKAEFHWIASGRINIPKHLPQYKKLQTTLRKAGLQGPIKNMELG